MRSREFLEKSQSQVSQEVSANKSPHGPKEALELARQAKKLVVAKGSKVVDVDMKRKPSDGELLEHLLGPTGKLRAPTMKVGTTLYVGFPKEGFPGLS